MRVVIVGGGGHASDVLGAFEMAGRARQVIGYQDDNGPDPRRFAGRAEHVGKIGPHPKATHYVMGIGWPATRRMLSAPMEGLAPLTIIHPDATVHPSAQIGKGVVILAGARISPGVVIGDHVLIHQNAIIGHDCQIGDFVSVMPGAAVSGDTTLEEGCMVGANATVIQRLVVGRWATLGAGSTATKDIPPHVTAIGSPARWPSEEAVAA